MTNSYAVDASGHIAMPLIGSVLARGATTDELSRRMATSCVKASSASRTSPSRSRAIARSSFSVIVTRFVAGEQVRMTVPVTRPIRSR